MDHEKTPCRLIDADAFIEKYCKDCGYGCKAEDGMVCATVDDLKKFPTVDAVEVVRCIDCKFFVPDEICFSGSGSCWFCEMVRNFDDFCSYGERKDNDQN